MNEDYKLELKRIYKLSSKLCGRYKLLFKDTERFTMGLLDTTAHEEGLALCEQINNILEETSIFD